MSSAHQLTPFPARREEHRAPKHERVKKPVITVAEPYPLLDPGEYVALCTEASYAWARQWGAWKARLVLEPQDYRGRPYTGRLCKFLGLGKNPEAPFAGSRSEFRILLVEVNGEQPARPNVDMTIFEGRLYRITVETVTKARTGEPLAPVHHYSTVRKIHAQKPTTPFNPQNLRNPENRGNPLTDQQSNRGTLASQAMQRDSAAKNCEGESLGSSPDHEPNYPEGGAGRNSLPALPGKKNGG